MKTAIAVTALLCWRRLRCSSLRLDHEGKFGLCPRNGRQAGGRGRGGGARVFAKVTLSRRKFGRRIDLPMRVLIWEEDGVTRIGYEDPQDLKARYGIDARTNPSPRSAKPWKSSPPPPPGERPPQCPPLRMRVPPETSTCSKQQCGRMSSHRNEIRAKNDTKVG